MKHNKITFFILSIAAVVLIFVFSTEKTYTTQIFALDTVIDIKINTSKNGNKILMDCKNRISTLENMFSVTMPNSDISKINQNAGNGNDVYIHSETMIILQKAIEISKLTDGAFDVTIGNLVETWGFINGNTHIPSNESIYNATNLTNYNSLILNTENSTAKLKLEGQKINLGAIAKGFIADDIASLLKESSVSSALINLGGNTYALGARIDNTPWNIGIQSPVDTNAILGTIELFNQSCVTSGDYERFFIKDNIRYHHIINPKTGYPAESGIHSVTIISDSSMLSDALSTACFVLGIDKSMDILNNTNADAIFYKSNGEIIITDDIKDKFKLTKTE